MATDAAYRAAHKPETGNITDELRKKLADTEYTLALLKDARHKEEKAEITARALRNQIWGLKEVPVEPTVWMPAPRRHISGITGVPIFVWSDWHYGEVINPDQVNGQNAFNNKIAMERIDATVNTTVDLVKNHMTNPSYPGVVVVLAGDMLSGSIHDELVETNQGTVLQQMLDVQGKLASCLQHLIDEFGLVKVVCVVGNHPRDTMKPRAKNLVFHSYEWAIYQNLEWHFRDENRIEFLIPNGADAFFTIQGHRFMVNHGDTIGVKGGDGMIGSIGPIARGTMKMGRAERFDTLIIGHWHNYIPRADGNPVFVNPCLKGYDEYARTKLRALPTRAAQGLFFVHPEHGITAQWQVYLQPPFKPKTVKGWL